MKSDPSLEYPDLQLHMLPVTVKWKDGSRTAEKASGHGITILACDIRPESRGEVRLQSKDASTPPIVDPNYLAAENDMEVSVKGIKLIRKVLQSPAFAPFLGEETMPGPAVQTDDEIRKYILEWGKTDYHPVGTCKMGVDEMAVVGPDLKVHGIENLRVIDSSIMPSIISGNTQAPAMMIGEKGASLVLGLDRPVGP